MANKIKTYSDFQQFMDDCCTKANANPDGAPHRRWWRRMTYDSFIRDGTVLGLRIVAPGDPANSNMVKALEGDPPTISGPPLRRARYPTANFFSAFATSSPSSHHT